MLNFLCLSLLMCSLCVFSQNTYHTSIIDEAAKLAKKGEKAYRKRHYLEADSLYSLSLEINPSSSIYKYRAFSRKEMKRYNGYCEDLVASYKYGDTDAKIIFNSDCVVGNAFYVDSLMKKSTKQNSYYNLNFIKYKFKNQQEYYKNNNKDELIEGYRVCEKDTLFYYVLPSTNNFSPDIKDFISYVSKNLVYPNLEFISGVKGTVYTEITISEYGRVIKTEILYAPSRGLEAATKKVLSSAPGIQPFIYKGRFVKSILQFPVIFNLN